MNPPRSPCAGSLFECVAEQDYDGLLSVLAAEGIRVLQHRASWAGKYHGGVLREEVREERRGGAENPLPSVASFGQPLSAKEVRRCHLEGALASKVQKKRPCLRLTVTAHGVLRVKPPFTFYCLP